MNRKLLMDVKGERSWNELATAAGISPSYMSLIRKGKRALTKQTAEKLAEISEVEISAEDLLSEEFDCSKITVRKPRKVKITLELPEDVYEYFSECAGRYDLPVEKMIGAHLIRHKELHHNRREIGGRIT